MATQGAAGQQNSAIAPVMAFFQQFIAHDIQAMADPRGDILRVNKSISGPLARHEVETGLLNLRAGMCDLGSLYGDGPVQGPLAQKFAEALRHPRNRALLWAGTVEKSPFDPVPIPNDPRDRARDLLRVDQCLASRSAALSGADFKALPQPLRGLFMGPDGRLQRNRAIIGDLRNDDTLGLAQFHLAMVRLHNRIVAQATEHGDARNTQGEALFRWARGMMRWHYQWLVINAFLPAICDAQVLGDVRQRGPVLYARFLARIGRAGPGVLPIPLEFSLAAFRIGAVMMRESYDWSFQFGRPEGRGLERRAGRGLLVAWSGNANGAGPGGSWRRLPQHMPIDWARFVHAPTADKPDRSARRIGPGLGGHAEGAALARDTLALGCRLNVPTAQACLAGLRRLDGIVLPALGRAQIGSGQTGDAVRAGGFETHTPLWFYVLKEAEVLGTEGRLGPLGSLIVADTLIGLITHDPASYLNAAFPNKAAWPGGWHPRNGARPDGIVIASMAAMMEAARLL